MDRRVRKTHKAIMQAYFDLIRENKTTKVSVSDIARKADIDRKTRSVRCGESIQYHGDGAER